MQRCHAVWSIVILHVQSIGYCSGTGSGAVLPHSVATVINKFDMQEIAGFANKPGQRARRSHLNSDSV